MADDRTNVGNQDRSRVAGGEGYEVGYFAQKHGITPEEARNLIRQHGNDRETLDREAEKLKRNPQGKWFKKNGGAPYQGPSPLPLTRPGGLLHPESDDENRGTDKQEEDSEDFHRVPPFWSYAWIAARRLFVRHLHYFFDHVSLQTTNRAACCFRSWEIRKLLLALCPLWRSARDGNGTFLNSNPTNVSANSHF